MRKKLVWLLVVFVISFVARGQDNKEQKAQESVLLATLDKELGREFAKLKDKGTDPFYFMSYDVRESREVNISAEYGAIISRPMEVEEKPSRSLSVQIRIGSYKLDNTHKIRYGGGYFHRHGRGYYGGGGYGNLPIEDDEDAIRSSIWLATDYAFKAAQEQYTQVKTNKNVMVAEEDQSDDFSVEEPNSYIGGVEKMVLDKELWVKKIRSYSELLKKYPYIINSEVSLAGGVENRYFVSSEGTKIQSGNKSYRLFITAMAKAEDGMNLPLYESFEAKDEKALPSDAEVEDAITKIGENLKKLRESPIIEPYAGPAILINRSAAVFFHEIFGHRIEGHRQKDEEEGQTFTKKIGKKIMPEFISIADDPTVTKAGDIPLFGFYKYDEEGVPAQKANLVENGVLKSFLMSRSPVKNFPKSNGHGRGSWGNAVARQANLIVTSTNRIPMTELRKMLIEEAKKQGKSFGLLFNDIEGGFTITQRWMPQAFSVLPLIVTRVYVDETKPDEIVRGANIVGTPITDLEQILATGDDEKAFNGYCGAESGFIPVSAVAPSILMKNMEIEKRMKEQDRPPILSAPLTDAKQTDEKDVVFKALEDEMGRSKTQLKLEKFDLPYYVSYRAGDSSHYSVSAFFGVLTGEGKGRYRSFDSDIRVGDYVLDSSGGGYFGGFRMFAFGGSFGRGGGLALDDNYDQFRHSIWLASDGSYKSALDGFARKKADLETKKIKDRPDDFSKEEPVVLIQPPKELTFNKERWKALTKKVSAVFKKYPEIDSSGADFSAGYGNDYFVNSEGFKELITEHSGLGFSVMSSTRCDDGMPLGDSLEFAARTEDKMPQDEEILSAVAKMADKMVAIRNAPRAEDYTGPVLFEGEGAVGFFSSILPPLLQSRRPEEGGEQGFNAKLGKRVMPKFITCYDDPSQEEFNSKLLRGFYTVDRDGMRGQRLDLIKNGKLETLYMGRVPTKELKKSNGHAQGIGNLFIESSKKVPLPELKKMLLEEAEAQDLEYGLLVRKFGEGGGENREYGSIYLSTPYEIYRVYVKDGREDLIRGASLSGASYRTIRDDIMATGDDTNVSCEGQSIICPSILIKQLEVKKPPEEFRKPPLIKNPYFEEKEKK